MAIRIECRNCARIQPLYVLCCSIICRSLVRFAQGQNWLSNVVLGDAANSLGSLVRRARKAHAIFQHCES